MSLKIRLSILFTLLAGSILFLFALLVYFSASTDRRNEFFNLLQKEALTRANLLLDAGVDAQTLQTIYLSNREILNEVEVAIYDPWFNLIYHDAVEIDFVKETPEMINEILEKEEIRFVQEDWEVIGMVFHFNDKTYILTAAAFDEYGHTKLRNLFNNLIFYWLAGVLLIFAAGWYFAQRALKPVVSMVHKAGEITATNLDLRLNEGKRKDELNRLAATFNQMLDRLQDSFEAQKEFVSNIAHELRTPLAAIVGEIELTLAKPRNEDQYKVAMEKALQDATRLSRLSTVLLDLARANYDPSKIARQKVRIDEVLLDARSDVIKKSSQHKIELVFQEPSETDHIPEIKGNEYLLRVAFANLMENGCKFSEGTPVVVDLSWQQQSPLIRITDSGTGISEDELENIFKPFYRGRNKRNAGGSGLGLPLVKRILELHHGTIEVSSKEGQGTTVMVKMG